MSKPMSEQMQKLADRYEKATGKKFGARTNADRIRAMSDEEMAEWVTSGGNCVMTICDHICGGKCNAIKTFKKSSEEACKEIVMKWLQQPAEEDDHGS